MNFAGSSASTPLGQVGPEPYWSTAVNVLDEARGALAGIQEEVRNGEPTFVGRGTIVTNCYLMASTFANYIPLDVIGNWVTFAKVAAEFSTTMPPLDPTPIVAANSFLIHPGKSTSYIAINFVHQAFVVERGNLVGVFDMDEFPQDTAKLWRSVGVMPSEQVIAARAIATPEPQPQLVFQGSAAYERFKQVGHWLGITDEATADLLGVGRTTPYSWRRNQSGPRPSTAGRLFEYHALLASMLDRLGEEGLRSWLRVGIQPPLRLLLKGDLSRAYDAAHHLLFRDPNQPKPGLGALQDEPITEPLGRAGTTDTDELRGRLRKTRPTRG